MLTLKGKKIDVTAELVNDFEQLGFPDITAEILNVCKSIPEFNKVLRKHAKIQARERTVPEWVRALNISLDDWEKSQVLLQERKRILAGHQAIFNEMAHDFDEQKDRVERRFDNMKPLGSDGVENICSVIEFNTSYLSPGDLYRVLVESGKAGEETRGKQFLTRARAKLI